MSTLKTFVRRRTVEEMFPDLRPTAIDDLLNSPDFPKRVYATGTSTPFWVLDQLEAYQQRMIAESQKDMNHV